MKRRTLLRGIAAAFAIGMSSAFLNTTKLTLAVDLAENESIGTLSVWKVYSDGFKELISSKHIPIVDNGVNQISPPYTGHGKTYKFPIQGKQNVSEIGVPGAKLGEFQRVVFKESISVKEDEYLEMEYHYEQLS